MLHTSIGNYLRGGLLLGILGGKLGLVKSLLKTHLLYISVGKKCCFWFSNCNYNVCIFSYYVAHCVSSHFTIWVKKQFFGVSNMTKRKKNCSNRAWSLIGYIKLLWYKIAPPGFVFWIRNKKIIDLTYRMFWRQGWYKKRIESIPF